MAKCPYCGRTIKDAWIRHHGARLMGSKGGKTKSRSPEQARAAANVRWQNRSPPKE